MVLNCIIWFSLVLCGFVQEVCKLSLFGPMETGLSSWNSWNWLLELGLFCHGSEFCIDGSELLWDLLGIHELLDWLWSVELDLELSSL